MGLRELIQTAGDITRLRSSISDVHLDVNEQELRAAVQSQEQGNRTEVGYTITARLGNKTIDRDYLAESGPKTGALPRKLTPSQLLQLWFDTVEEPKVISDWTGILPRGLSAEFPYNLYNAYRH